MSTFVLIPGGGLGGWAWSRVTPLLRGAGHDPHPITLTGTGDRAHLNGPGINLTSWITDVVAHIETEELQDVMLVGHSFSGTVASGVVQRIPGRIMRVVYLDALVPRDGHAIFDDMGPEQAGFIRSLAQAHDGWSLPWFTDAQLAQVFPGHGLSSADLAWVRRHVTAQPIATYEEALSLGTSQVPRTFVRCLRTPLAGAIPEDAPGWSHRSLDAGHWPMISAPQATAALLAEIAP